MAEFTHIVHAEVSGDGQLFSTQLARAVKELGLSAPYCRGRQLANGRWEIEANIRGRAIAPYTEDTIITKEYPN